LDRPFGLRIPGAGRLLIRSTLWHNDSPARFSAWRDGCLDAKRFFLARVKSARGKTPTAGTKASIEVRENLSRDT
jgi:hypothetical protein